ncbi:thiamine diphosphokinase [Oscillibacter sp.]|uniref:thiamine diphosphokinase n=1 Tax=Oscillibacter sp. TaxID=1945593 RepID=UPI003FA6E096
MGLACDPVAGLVEVPCVKRNVIGAMHAVAAADMALAGIESRIPVDEVIDAMGEGGRRLPVEKDDTDTLAALRAGLEQACDIFYIYGGTGGKRLDHTLANLQSLLFLRRRGARGFLYDDDFVWTVIENEALTVPKTVEWGLFSAFCLGDRAEGVDEEGFQYPLKDAVLTPEFPLGVSNHILEPSARISVRKGALAVGWELASLD